MSRSNSDDALFRNPYFQYGFRLRSRAFVATAEFKIPATDAPVLLVDPGGAARTILLPPEAESKGLVFFIFNTADAAETLTVEEDSSTTAITALTQGSSAMLHCDGVTWRDL